MEGNIRARCLVAEADALIIQCSVQYRRSTETATPYTFVFHVKQVDIAIDTSPVPWRSPPQFNQEHVSGKSTDLFSADVSRCVA